MDCAENHSMEHTSLLEGKATVYILSLCVNTLSVEYFIGQKKMDLIA